MNIPKPVKKANMVVDLLDERLRLNFVTTGEIAENFREFGILRSTGVESWELTVDPRYDYTEVFEWYCAFIEEVNSRPVEYSELGDVRDSSVYCKDEIVIPKNVANWDELYIILERYGEPLRKVGIFNEWYARQVKHLTEQDEALPAEWRTFPEFLELLKDGKINLKVFLSDLSNSGMSDRKVFLDQLFHSENEDASQFLAMVSNLGDWGWSKLWGIAGTVPEEPNNAQKSLRSVRLGYISVKNLLDYWEVHRDDFENDMDSFYSVVPEQWQKDFLSLFRHNKEDWKRFMALCVRSGYDEYVRIVWLEVLN